MSLFPSDKKSGMSAFQGKKDPQSKAVSEKEKQLESKEIKVPIQTSEIPAEIAEKNQETENIEKIEKTENIRAEKLENKEIETVKEVKETKLQTADLKTEEEKADIPKVEKKESPKTDDNFDFPTSVKIAGLTAEEDLKFIPSFVPASDEDKSNLDSHNDESVNISDSEKEELEELSKAYFEEFDSSQALDKGMSLDDLLELCIEKEASDIHFSALEKIGLRINGKIYFIDNYEKLSHKEARHLVFSLVQNPIMRKQVFEDRELDCAFEHKSGVAFRVNIFFKRGRLAGVLRRIASQAKSMEELGLPEAVTQLLNAKQGLLLVTGPTGSGKSTSMQSMLEYINENRVEHILTIEDPVEFIFKNKKSIFSQREIGRDTKSFSAALRASLREDPDVVMIGEMRDPETIQAAMNLSETGHLVISTLHTSSAPQTVSRLISQFPPEEQHQILGRLGDTLIGVLSQRLVPRADKEGRIAIFELLIVNSAVRHIVKSGDLTQIHNAMIAGREAGMVRMEDYAEELEERGIIEKDSYIHFFREE